MKFAPERSRSRRLALPALAVLLALAALVSVAAGAVAISPGQVLGILGAHVGLTLPWPFDESQAAIVNTLRLPRVALGALVGAGLGVSGTALQGLFRNPLVDPGLIGISAGAALGAALCIVLGTAALASLPGAVTAVALPIAAFAGGLLATLAVYRFAQRDGRTSVSSMLLAGIAVNALIGAGVALLSFVSNDAQLRQLTFWSFGSLGGANWRAIAIAAPLVLIPVLVLLRLSTSLNAMLLGESEAGHLGVAVERIKLIAVVCSALAVGASVALAGLIGFVGLVVPHLLRLVLGPDHRLLVPGAALLGAALLLAADVVSRIVVAPAELPIGIVTAFIGAPTFLLLLARGRRTGVTA